MRIFTAPASASRAVRAGERRRRFISGLAVIAALAAAGGAAVLVRPASREPVEIPVVAAAGAPVQVACGGQFSNQFEGGVSAQDITEDIVHTSALLATGTGSVSGPNGLTSGEGSVVATTNVGAGYYHTEGTGITLAGGATFLAKNGDARGLAVSPCVTPERDAWLVGSASGVGHTNVLYITNPGERAVTVSIEAFGAAGPLDLGSATSVSVESGATMRFGLDGLIPDDPRIALHLTTKAGAFGAVLQSGELNGATAAGVDVIQPSQPGDTSVIPGITVSDAASVLRVVNPGRDTTFSLTLYGPDGIVEVPGTTDVPISASAVLDLSLGGVPKGSYTAVVTGSGQLAAGVQNVAGSSPRDVAWIPATAPTTRGAAAWGEGLTGVVQLYSTETAAPTVESYRADGTLIRTDTVAVRTAGSLSLPEGTASVIVRSEIPVYGTVNLSAGVEGGTGIAAIGLTSALDSTDRARISVAN